MADDSRTIGNLNDTPIWFRIILSIAMLGGAGSGYTLINTSTADRYYAAQARSDFMLRDERMARLQKDITRLEEKVRNQSHPPAEFKRVVEGIQLRLRKIEDRMLSGD